jgi:hypothetical protein
MRQLGKELELRQESVVIPIRYNARRPRPNEERNSIELFILAGNALLRFVARLADTIDNIAEFIRHPANPKTVSEFERTKARHCTAIL